MNLVRFAYPKPDFGGHLEFFTSPEWDSRELFICFFQDRFLSRSAKKMTCRMDKCLYLVRFVYPKLDFGGHHECWYFHELEFLGTFKMFFRTVFWMNSKKFSFVMNLFHLKTQYSMPNYLRLFYCDGGHLGFCQIWNFSNDQIPVLRVDSIDINDANPVDKLFNPLFSILGCF